MFSFLIGKKILLVFQEESANFSSSKIDKLKFLRFQRITAFQLRFKIKYHSTEFLFTYIRDFSGENIFIQTLSPHPRWWKPYLNFVHICDFEKEEEEEKCISP